MDTMQKIRDEERATEDFITATAEHLYGPVEKSSKWDGTLYTAILQKRPAKAGYDPFGDDRGGNYGDTVVLGVFTTQELADEALRRTNYDSGMYRTILDVRKVDSLPPERDLRPRDYLKDPLPEEMKKIGFAPGDLFQPGFFDQCDFCEAVFDESDPGTVAWDGSLLCKLCAVVYAPPPGVDEQKKNPKRLFDGLAPSILEGRVG
jgi:rubredoxin